MEEGSSHLDTTTPKRKSTFIYSGSQGHINTESPDTVPGVQVSGQNDDGSLWGPTSTIVNTTLGAGILALPLVYRLCGVGLATILLWGMATVSWFSATLLVLSSKITEQKTYAALGRYMFGEIFIVEGTLVLMTFGALVAFFKVVTETLTPMVFGFFGLVPLTHHTALFIFNLALFVIIPLSLQRDVGAMATMSMVSVFLCTIFTVVIVSQTFFQTVGTFPLPHLKWFDMRGFFYALPIVSIAYNSHSITLPVYYGLRRASIEMHSTVTFEAILICMGIYFLVGFFGYVSFGEGTQGNLLINFEDGGLIVGVLKSCLLISVILSFPVTVLPCQRNIFAMFSGEAGDSGEAYGNKPMVVRVVIILCALALSLLVPSTEFALGLTGATCGILISFTYPALFYVSFCKDDVSTNKTKLAAYALLWGSLVVLVLSTVTILSAKVESLTPVAYGVDDLVGVTDDLIVYRHQDILQNATLLTVDKTP